MGTVVPRAGREAGRRNNRGEARRGGGSGGGRGSGCCWTEEETRTANNEAIICNSKSETKLGYDSGFGEERPLGREEERG